MHRRRSVNGKSRIVGHSPTYEARFMRHSILDHQSRRQLVSSAFQPNAAENREQHHDVQAPRQVKPTGAFETVAGKLERLVEIDLARIAGRGAGRLELLPDSGIESAFEAEAAGRLDREKQERERREAAE